MSNSIGSPIAAMRPATAKWLKLGKKSSSTPHDSSSSNAHRAMSKEAPLSLAERDFILEALREDVRLDGRQPDQYRPINLSFGEEYGHVRLQLGKTRYVPSSGGSEFC